MCGGDHRVGVRVRMAVARSDREQPEHKEKKEHETRVDQKAQRTTHNTCRSPLRPTAQTKQKRGESYTGALHHAGGAEAQWCSD